MQRITKWNGWYFWEQLNEGFEPSHPIRWEAWSTLASAATRERLDDIIRESDNLY